MDFSSLHWRSAISKGENTSIQEQAGMNDMFIFFQVIDFQNKMNQKTITLRSEFP